MPKNHSTYDIICRYYRNQLVLPTSYWGRHEQKRRKRRSEKRHEGELSSSSSAIITATSEQFCMLGARDWPLFSKRGKCHRLKIMFQAFKKLDGVDLSKSLIQNAFRSWKFKITSLRELTNVNFPFFHLLFIYIITFFRRESILQTLQPLVLLGSTLFETNCLGLNSVNSSSKHFISWMSFHWCYIIISQLENK